MIMKNILGLDLGTNSIGWALIQRDFNQKEGHILGMGSRIIPMSQDIKDEFGKGNSISQTADRTKFRSVRRLRERHLLRRARLHRVLNILGFLPEHYASQIDFVKHPGKFLDEKEPKLAYDNKIFIFKKSFEEMLIDFHQYQPQLLEDGRKIPYDWTIYYLRKKALTKRIEKDELAWLILNFNQKRGYYQLRGEEEHENPNKITEFHSLKITDVIADENQKGKAETWYSLILENGWTYRRASKIPLYDWRDKQRDFIVTTDLNDDGSIKTDKEGQEKRSFRAPGEDDWTLIKKKTEQQVINAGKTVGTYIYGNLLQNPQQKIKGKLVRTIEREFYKDELKAILTAQQKFHPELNDRNLYVDCVRELYCHNEPHQNTLDKRDIVHLFIDDIIFYQRPLRSQKSSVGNCTLEFRKYKNDHGIDEMDYLKAIPKSHPLFQEFRLWQWIYNLSIYQKDDDVNVTDELIKNMETYQNLFDFLNNKKEIRQDILIKFLLEQSGLKGKELALTMARYRWNFVEDKIYPCNETGTQIRTRLAKVENIPEDFFTKETELKLWHIIYSVNDKTEYEKALKTFAATYNLHTASFVEHFKKFPVLQSEYGSFSEKAIKKLLPLIRLGKYWSWENIDWKTRARIEKILTGEFDENIQNRVREKAISLMQETDFQGLQLWLASYVVYGRHSEAVNLEKWNTAADVEKYLAGFRQHSLRNPIVEQVVTETLRVVKDIWSQYGQGAKDFFDEIHVELAREMKNTGEERKRLTSLTTDNENTNLRIKVLLSELFHGGDVENVRPYSPMQQEALKIFEDGVLNSDIKIDDDILKISKTAQPTSTELKRYKLWLEQKYRSPYTGEIIPLSRLFTADYEIEHIIPQSRFFDDSFSNKIICESAVNQLKDKQLGLEFIKNHSGTIVKLGLGKTARVLDVGGYSEFVKGNYAKSPGKRNKLLLEEIPDKMIERQLNDTRYISKFITSVLSNIVRSETNDDGFNSKNILYGNGKITSRLRQDWGMNDVWNELILSRFQRMNQVTNSNVFTAWNENNQKFLPVVPLEFSKGFQKKRIDHRHHALDALVIAASTSDHVNLLNNEHAKSNKRFDLNRKLRMFEKTAYKDPWTGERIEKEIPGIFMKPWTTFTAEAKNKLENTIISFKQNLRVINRTTNHIESYKDEYGELRLGKKGELLKGKFQQTKGDSWAIRKPMHKDFVYGKVDLKDIKVIGDKFITAIRKTLDATFDLKKIGTITDTGIQKILKNYLYSKENKPELAFSPEGIEDMNQHIESYNDGKKHQPIYKVRVFEIGSRFPLGETGNKKAKFVEAAKGTNLFFAVYQDDKGKRYYETIPLNIVIERQKQGYHSVPTSDDKGRELVFHLSPNDLVYVPVSEELENSLASLNVKQLNKEQRKRVYKVEKFSGVECYFVRHDIACLIKNYDAKTKVGELESQNKLQSTMTDDRLKITDVCIKLNVDRLGNINEALFAKDR